MEAEVTEEVEDDFIFDDRMQDEAGDSGGAALLTRDKSVMPGQQMQSSINSQLPRSAGNVFVDGKIAQ